MPLGVAQDLSDEEHAALEALRTPEPDDDLGPEPEVEADQAGAQPEKQAEAAAEQAQPEPAAPEQPDAAADEAARHRANMRAARAAERRALAKAERLEREIEELRARVPAAAEQDDDALSDDDIRALEETDIPALAKAARLLRKTAQMAATQAVPEREQAQPEFVPPVLPPAVQDAVDEVPDLLTWQNTPDQKAFEMAKKVDAFLLTVDRWQSVPATERLAEVVKRVKAELGQSAPTPPRPQIDPKQAIADAPARTPRSIGEIGSGGGRQPAGNDVARFAQMSAEDVEAELLTRGH